MKEYQFTVDGPLVGFVVHAAPWTQKAKRYVQFKNTVRVLAHIAGVPEEIPKNHRATISIAVAWKKKARIDLSNILKAVEDGLFVRDRGIGEIHATKLQHTGVERASVFIQLEDEGKQNGKPIKVRESKA